MDAFALQTTLSWKNGKYGKSVHGKPWEKCHRFWLRLRQAVILISNVRTSASKKINLMAIFRTLTISSTTFERMKEKFDGFRQTEMVDRTFYLHLSSLTVYKVCAKQNVCHAREPHLQYTLDTCRTSEAYPSTCERLYIDDK